MQSKMNMIRGIDDFTRAYIVCALWSSTDDSGEPLDKNYTWADIAAESLAKIIADCTFFQKDNAKLLTQYYSELPAKGEWTHAERAGHDFWLSRNGHGAGFFDREVSAEIKDKLQELAHNWGECYLYVGDDGKLYI